MSSEFRGLQVGGQGARDKAVVQTLDTIGINGNALGDGSQQGVVNHFAVS